MAAKHYLLALSRSVGGKWFLLPGCVSGLIGIYGFEQSRLEWLPPMNWWAIFPLALAPVILWVTGGLTKRVVDLEEQIRPKLRCSFSMDDDGCVRPVPAHDPIETYYRIKVEAAHNINVTGCCCRLLRIEHDSGSIISGETPILPFVAATALEAVGKTVHPDAPEYVDFICINHEDAARLILHLPSATTSVNWNGVFSRAGNHTLHVVIVSSAGSIRRTLLFNWTGDHTTARITDITGQISQS
jgi:hypothetical protein